MTKQEMKNLVKSIKRNFNPYFGFPEGFIEASFDSKYNVIILKIGHREIEIDKEGIDVGADTSFELEFIIKKVD
jgi:hypothetical protein